MWIQLCIPEWISDWVVLVCLTAGGLQSQLTDIRHYSMWSVHYFLMFITWLLQQLFIIFLFCMFKDYLAIFTISMHLACRCSISSTKSIIAALTYIQMSLVVGSNFVPVFCHNLLLHCCIWYGSTELSQ